MASCSIILLLLLFLCVASANFSFDPFNTESFNSGCTLFGNVTTNTNSVDLIPDVVGNSQGKVYSKERFRFKNATTAASFSTFFTFQISTWSGWCVGDGMAFFVQADPTPMASGDETAMGLKGNSTNPFLAVEFDTNIDTVDSSDCGGKSSSCYIQDATNSAHVGIDLNSMSSVNHTCYAKLVGSRQQAWIDYDAHSQILEVRITNESSTRPSTPFVSAQVNLLKFLNSDYLHVGISAATSGAGETNTIYSWSFNITQLEEPLSDPAPAPAPATALDPSSSSKKNTRSVTLIVAVTVPVVCAFFFACLICIIIKRAQTRKKKRQNLPQIAELQMSLAQYSYADLTAATKRFSEEMILGEGGYGKVYKGVLPGDGSSAAIKVMSAKGLHQFLAELSVIGHLKHKNLVRLKGWCHHQEKLILVYDYMPNGSLDQHLFSKDKMLTWSQRFEIVKGIAEGLLFLHAGWEQRIVHRDIKAANVLLDSKFAARLGDFGLSKLMEDNKTQQTMTQAGTRGYIAPELAYLGRANEKSDIYSFGILLLEIACGKSVLNFAYGSREYEFLLDWVWEAHFSDELLGVADPRLCAHYNKDEMRTVLSLGLLCSHADADLRPGMRRCCQILNCEAALPDLPNSKPTVFFGDHSQLSSAVFSQSTSSAGQSNGISKSNKSGSTRQGSGISNTSNSERSSLPLLHHTSY